MKVQEMRTDAWFLLENKGGKNVEGESDEYHDFVKKFEKKKTTDDCYTPYSIYKVVLDYVIEKYGVKEKDVVRPFFPGGDYKAVGYAKNSVVVDNPPFSICSEICEFYIKNGIRFFLFAPSLTVFHVARKRCMAICTGAAITYENGAVVSTSFVTNMEGEKIFCRSDHELYKAISEENDRLQKEGKTKHGKYIFPDNVVTAALVNKWSKYGVEYSVKREECKLVSTIDELKDRGKTIFGSGLLLSDRAAAERAAAERAAACKLELSEREKEIVKQLGKKGEQNV